MNMKVANNHEGTKPRRAESGQAIVLMALVAVMLLGMLGLAVDGGGLYFLWRDAQNASDAAVMAATYARCTHGDVTKAALQAAAQNGFDNNGISNTVKVFTPTDGIGANNDNYIQVNINAQKPSYFVQIVYKKPLEVTTHAVGFCIPPIDPDTVPAIYGGARTCGNTVNISNSTLTIDHGGIWSNDDLKITSEGPVKGDSGAASGVEANHTTWETNDGAPATAPPGDSDPKSDPLNLNLADYAPGGASANRAPLYEYISYNDPDVQKQGDKYTWNPPNDTQLEGLYYFAGDVSIGVGVDADGDRNGDGRHDGITIVATGTITLNAGPGKNIHYYSGGGGDGIIAFSGAQTNCGNNAVTLSGSDAEWTGIIYAPYGGIDMGLANLRMTGALIGYTVSLHGSDFYLKADPILIPGRAPSVQMAE